MALAAIAGCRAIPVVEIGIGDSRGAGLGGVWGRSTAPVLDRAHWSGGRDPEDTWNGYQPTWVDVTCETHEVSGLFTGRDRTTDQWEVGTGTVVLDNDTGWATFPPRDPNADVVVRPGRPLRVRVIVDGVSYVLWRGYVDEANPGFDPELGPTVTLECIDAKGEAGRGEVAEVATATGAGVFIHQRLADILTRQAWPLYWRNIDVSGIKVIATTYGESAVDALNRTADSGGGSIFGGADGKVTFRNRDWQMWETGTPEDGTIGNSQQVVTVAAAVPGYARFPGTTGNMLSTPDTNAFDIQNDITIIARIDRWGAPTALTHQTIAAKWNGAANQRSYGLTKLNTADKRLRFHWSPALDGVTSLNHASSAPVPDTSPYVAVTFDANNGAGGHSTRFWHSVDRLSWTQLGTTQTTTTAPSSLFVGTAALTVGDAANASTIVPFNGDISYVSIRNGISPGGFVGGTEVFRLDPLNFVDAAAPTLIASSGQVVSVNKVGSPSTTITPYISEVQEIVPDYCPTQWELSFARADFTNRVMVSREDMTAPVVVDDTPNVVEYGVETFNMGDLMTQDNTELNQLAVRMLATRGFGTYDPVNPSARSYAPRIAGVELDASTADNVCELLATANPRTPTRYICRHHEEGRWQFQRNMFCTAIEHTITPDGWTARLSLDDATPWLLGADTGRWTTTGRWGRKSPKLNRSTWGALPRP